MSVRVDVALSRQKVLEIIENRVASGKPVTREAIAEEIGCHPNTVWRAIKDLRNTGQITMTQRGNPHVPTQYEVLGEERANSKRDA
jgi:Mn-dependent DtxR family transcriptional regulator